MTSSERILEIQRLYPLLYFACHDTHARRDGLSESDLRLLHHIGAQPGTFASALGRHLGLSRSRLSEALQGLERSGHIARTADGSGRKRIALTAAGEAALTATDGLDAEAIGAVLDQLAEEDQRRVIEALRLLAQAIGRHEQ